MKDIQVGKEELTVSLFADEMILYIKKNPENSTRKLYHRINTFNKGAGYKINIKISSLQQQQ